MEKLLKVYMIYCMELPFGKFKLMDYAPLFSSRYKARRWLYRYYPKLTYNKCNFWYESSDYVCRYRIVERYIQ